ncbi:MAG: GAF domain-containing protein [Planctomycetaceae bacterium]|nr:GAF domain-containing protein [Planctomycetaceae bacterium]
MGRLIQAEGRLCPVLRVERLSSLMGKLPDPNSSSSPPLTLHSRLSIVLKLTLFVGSLVALTAGTLILVGFSYTSAMLRDQIDNRLSAVADDRQALLMSGLLHLEERVRTLKSRYPLLEVLDRIGERTMTPQRLRESSASLDEVRDDTAGLLAFWIEDSTGRKIASSGPPALLEQFAGDRDPRRQGNRDPVMIGLPRQAGNTYGALFRTEARSRKHGVIGSLFLLLDVGPIMTVLADPRRLGKTGEVVVGIREGATMRFLFPPRLNPHERAFPISRTPGLVPAVSGEAGFMRTTDRLGRQVLAAYRPVGYEDWGLLAKMEIEEAYAPVNHRRRLLLILGALILAVGLTASYLIARQNTRSIRKLAAAAEAIAQGRPGDRIEVHSGDEIGSLELAFLRMTEQLEFFHADLEKLIAERTEEVRRLNQSLVSKAEELVQSEAALREQTRILQSVLDCMGEGVVVADSEARLLVFNPAAQRMLGSSARLGEPDRWNPQYKVYYPDRTTLYSTEDLPLYQAIRGKSMDHVELFIAQPSLQDGLWMLVNARPLRDESSRPQGGLVVFHDITRRKCYEQRLAAEFAATRVLAEADSLSEAIPKILAIVGQGLDWDFGAFWRLEQAAHDSISVTLWQSPQASLAGFTELTQRTPLRPGIGLPGRVWSSRKAAWAAELDDHSYDPRWKAAAADGLRSGFAVPILARGECVGVLELYSCAYRQVDPDLLEMMTNLGSQIGQFVDRHKMHARVVQSEKLASLGLLSAGVAHEINNPLSYIANNLAVLERDTRSLLALVATYEKARDLLEANRRDLIAEIDRLDHECDFAYIKANLDKILASTRHGVKRVAEIVHNLRGFARLDRAAVDQTDIHEALASALEMIRGRLERRRITVEERKGELPPVSASQVQINQVFLNLLVNAMQAIESTHRDDGRIVVETRCNGKEVILEVKDNGCGIPAEILPQIFDPFFTTKSVGDGTGLGLSITHGIVQDHGGRMDVETTAGQGTCFRVILPISRK